MTATFTRAVLIGAAMAIGHAAPAATITAMPPRFDAFKLSADGRVVSGAIDPTPSGLVQSSRWTAAGGIEPPPLLDALDAIDIFAISDTGEYVTGFYERASTGYRPEFMRQRRDGPTEYLPRVPGESSVFEPKGISTDGSIIGGWVSQSGGRGAVVRWTAAGGVVNLGTPSELPDGRSRVTAMSRDGSTLIGTDDNYNAPFVWREGTGFSVLRPPPLPEYSYEGGATATNRDGSLIAGYL